MKPVKRVEIIIGSVIMPVLIRNLSAAGFHQFTHIRHANGRGSLFDRTADDVTDVFAVDVLILAIDSTSLPDLNAAIGPMIESYGGICLVSDSMIMEQSTQ